MAWLLARTNRDSSIYAFVSHVALALLFILGHLWHACRALFKEIWTGVAFIILYQVEYGRNEKLGDKTTKWLKI